MARSFRDRVRAEGIASRDYPLLDIERGLIVVATRDYVPPDFVDMLKRHNAFLLNNSVGGWGKFIKDSLRKQKSTERQRHVPSKPKHNGKQQQKNGGKGWLHV